MGLSKMLFIYHLLLVPVAVSIRISYYLPRKGKSASEIQEIKWRTDANSTFAPFYASLRERNSFGKYEPHCGAILLSASWATTSAHCLYKNLFKTPFDISRFKVTAGEINLKVTSGTEQFRDIDRVYISPHYHDETRFSHDIALLYFATPFEINENVNAIDIDEDIPAMGESVFIAGYGRTYIRSASRKLRYLSMEVPDQTVILKHVSVRTFVDFTVFCTGSLVTRNRPDKGDSGGPAWVMRNNVPKLVGIPSFVTDPRAVRRSYICHTAVPRLKSWIKDTMNRDYVRLTVTESPQVFSWSNKRISYRNEFIKLECEEGCRLQIKYFEWDAARDKVGTENTMLQIVDSDGSVNSITMKDSAPTNYAGWIMKGNTTTVKIYGTFTKSAPVNIKFTYQAYNSTFEQVTCKGDAYRCNEVVDCQDLTDELGCEYSTNRSEAEKDKFTVGCYANDYKCPPYEISQRCIRESRLCDYSIDCTIDYDKENHDESPSDLTDVTCDLTKFFKSRGESVGPSLTEMFTLVTFQLFAMYLVGKA